MADNTNPHVVDPTQQGDSTKQISLELLKRYHHNLLTALRLTNDTGAYKYGGSRTDFPATGMETVGDALDKLYDMVKEGSVAFASGKADDADDTIEFNTDDDDDSNLYWINAKVGDETINIKLDADNFVKDSVLESVVLVTKNGNDYKVGGVEATYTAATDTEPSKLVVGEGETAKTYYGFNETEDGTYFHYTWKVDEGEKGITRSYTTISLKDVYGDLKGDDYITFDTETAQIKANVAEVVSEKETVTVDGTILGAEPELYIADAPEIKGETWSELKTALEAAGYTVGNYDGDANAFIPCTKEGSTVWSVDSENEKNLATAENVADVAQDLQEQIDAMSNQSTLLDGVVQYSTTEDTSLKSSVDENGSKYTLTIRLATDDEIDGMFSKCGPDDPTPSETDLFTTNSNLYVTDGEGNASIDNAGKYPLDDAEGTDMEYTIVKN